MRNPTDPTNTAKAYGAARAILIAYARGEANGGDVEWDDVDVAFELAREALPGEYESILERITTSDTTSSDEASQS